MDGCAYNELHYIEYVNERHLFQLKQLHTIVYQIRHRNGEGCTFTYMANNDLLICISGIHRPGYNYINDVNDRQEYDTMLHLVRLYLINVFHHSIQREIIFIKSRKVVSRDTK
jgi:hypothetical protein